VTGDEPDQPLEADPSEGQTESVPIAESETSDEQTPSPDQKAADRSESSDESGPPSGQNDADGPQRPAVYGDRYELRQLVATGGMAEVFLAHDRLLDRPVAVKRLYAEFAADRSFVERFEREAKAVAKLNHPNIVSVYDWGVEGDTQYLVMEYVEGRTLAEILHAEGRLHPDRAADIAIDVAAALTRAHRAGMVHKDIKAGNIMITTDGRVRVLDFGIARAVGGTDEALTDAGTVMGTATYFSPEQAQGLQVGPRGDLYSLGVVLYEMTVGQPPFDGKTPVAIAYKHVRDMPPSPTDVAPDVPVEIEAITLKLLAKDPDDRYPTAEDLRADLRRYREGHRMDVAPVPVPVPIPDPTPVPKPEIPDYEESPRRTGVFLFFLIILLLVVTAGLFLWAQVLSDEPGTSAGSRTNVPDVVGELVDAATTQLRSAGFEVAQEDERSDEVESGRVIRQDPAEGTRQTDGSTITITVSIGAGTIRLPNVVSLTEFGATQDLEALGLEVRRENREDTTRAEGLVIEQSPAAGAEVEQGSTVILTVSQGSELLALPDVAGLEREPAENLLQIVGCTVTEVLSQVSADVIAGLAIGTDPEAGTGIDQESCGVVLVMSTGAGAQDPNAPAG
jgi:serine/threonine-protein kinase